MSKFDHALVVKMTTMGVAAITIGAAVWGFFSDPAPKKDSNGDLINGSIAGCVLNCCNLVIIAMVLLPAEFQMEWIKEGFGFIDNLFGKGIYVFFIGSWVYCFRGMFDGGVTTYCMIVGIIDMCVGVLYVIFYFGFGEAKSS